MFFLCSGTTYSTQKTWNWKISPIWLILDDWKLKTYWVHFLSVFDGNMAMRCLILHLTPCPPPTNALCPTSRGWLFGTVGRGVHLVGYARRINRVAHFIEISAKHLDAFMFTRVACGMLDDILSPVTVATHGHSPSRHNIWVAVLETEIDGKRQSAIF
jgi:hypothetical protein